MYFSIPIHSQTHSFKQIFSPTWAALDLKYLLNSNACERNELFFLLVSVTI